MYHSHFLGSVVLKVLLKPGKYWFMTLTTKIFPKKKIFFFSRKLLTVWTGKAFQSTENQTSCLIILLDSSLVCDIGSPAFLALCFPECEQRSQGTSDSFGRVCFPGHPFSS